jgi:hypothetical protein
VTVHKIKGSALLGISICPVNSISGTDSSVRRFSNSARHLRPASHPCPNCPSCQFAARCAACVVGQIRTILLAVPRSTGGAFRDRHGPWSVGCGGRIGSQRASMVRNSAVAVFRPRPCSRCVRTNDSVRTVKPCGPDTPTLVSWSATMPMTGARKPGPLGEHGAAVKPSRREGRMSGSYLWFCRVLFVARGPWVRPAPGLPCALLFMKASKAARLGRDARREAAKPRRQVRDEDG